MIDLVAVVDVLAFYWYMIETGFSSALAKNWPMRRSSEHEEQVQRHALGPKQRRPQPEEPHGVGAPQFLSLGLNLMSMILVLEINDPLHQHFLPGSV